MKIIPLLVLFRINRIERQEMKLKELKNGRLALRLAAVVFGIVGGENMDEGGGFGGSSGSFLVLGKQLHVFCQDGTCLKSFGMFEKV